jgi:C4-dicarboxylate-specific signal transduction histidine kinase
VLINLIRNALDAAQADDAWHMTVTLEKDGNMAIVRISNCAASISDHAVRRLFGLFYD